MAQKKKFKTTEPLQADPWLAWCSPVYKSEAQDWLLDFPEVRQEFERDPTEYLESMRESCVAKYLFEAADEVSDRSREIVPEVPDVKAHPIPALEYLSIYTGEICHDTITTLPQLLEDNPFHCNLFRNLLMLTVAWPHKQAVNQLKELAPNVIRFLMAAHRFLKKKIAFANTMGLKRTAKKLENADKSLCMIELTGDMDKDAKQLFLVKRITPEDFRIAMRSAFKLDREATEEINSRGMVYGSEQKNDTNNPPRKDIPQPVRCAIMTTWEEYQKAPDKYTPGVLKRKRGQKPNYTELLEYRGNDVIHKNKTLSQLLDDYKNPNEKPLNTLSRILDSERKSQKRKT